MRMVCILVLNHTNLDGDTSSPGGISVLHHLHTTKSLTPRPLPTEATACFGAHAHLRLAGSGAGFFFFRFDPSFPRSATQTRNAKRHGAGDGASAIVGVGWLEYGGDNEGWVAS